MGPPAGRGGRVLAAVPQVVGEVEEGEEYAVPLPGRLPGHPGVVVGGCDMLARRGRSSPVPRVITITKPARKQIMFSMIWFLKRVRGGGQEDKVLGKSVGRDDVEDLPPATDVGGGGEEGEYHEDGVEETLALIHEALVGQPALGCLKFACCLPVVVA